MGSGTDAGLRVAIRDRAINCLDTTETLGIGELRNLLITRYRFFYPRRQEGSCQFPHDPWCQTSTFPSSCRECGQGIFIFSSTCGSAVVFDRLGWPSAEHVCVGRDVPKGPASSRVLHVDTDGDQFVPASHSLGNGVLNADRARISVLPPNITA